MSSTAFYPGSFDPPTLGHLEVVRRAAALFDRLVVGIGVHADKRPWLAADIRRKLLGEVLPAGVAVVSFDGLAVAAAREAGATVLVRGLRGGADAETEMLMAWANRRLDAGIDTVFLPSSSELSFVSSRLVREVHRSGGDLTPFVPEAVVRHLRSAGP